MIWFTIISTHSPCRLRSKFKTKGRATHSLNPSSCSKHRGSALQGPSNAFQSRISKSSLWFLHLHLLETSHQQHTTPFIGLLSYLMYSLYSHYHITGFSFANWPTPKLDTPQYCTSTHYPPSTPVALKTNSMPFRHHLIILSWKPPSIVSNCGTLTDGNQLLRFPEQEQDAMNQYRFSKNPRRCWLHQGPVALLE